MKELQLHTSEAPVLGEQCFFGKLLDLVQTSDEVPGWPDAFGLALNRLAKRYLTRPIKVLSLFSGGGGLDIGFHDAGFDITQMIEVNPQYVETLKANCVDGGRLFGGRPNCVDIRNFCPSEDLEVDFVIGGPPCQTFSAAGRRAAGVSGIDDPRGNLFKEYIRILKTLKPKGFLFENVYGIVGAQNGKPWKLILEAFKAAGYQVSYQILDTADYGVPQHRERLIIVGTQDKHFLFPRPTHGPDSPDKRFFYTAGLATLGTNDDKPKAISGRYGHLLNDIPPGLNYSFYTEKLGHPSPVFAWRSKFSDFLYKADPEMPVRTIKAQGGQYTGPFHWESRAFSIDELKRLQTFPSEYVLTGGKQTVIEQVGNSVPPQFARILGIAVLDQVFDVELPCKISYLSPNEKLGFRARKRLSNKVYEDKARRKILEFSINNSSNCSVLPSYNCSESKDIAEEKKPPFLACLGKDFSLIIQNDRQQDCDWNIRGEIKATNKSLDFFIGSPDVHIDGQIVVEVSPTKSWIIPYKKVIFYIQSSSPYLFTAAWKIFENYINREGIKADLVQLNGYYQYKPSIISKVTKLEINCCAEDFQYWEVIKQITEGKGVRRILGLDELSISWQLPRETLVRALLKLRSLGYEVRSEYTNNQIPKDCILIPYSFPTLTPRSVQLHKILFPLENSGTASVLQSLSLNMKESSQEIKQISLDLPNVGGMATEKQLSHSNLCDPDLRKKPHLEIYDSYSILVGLNDEISVVWHEGRQTQDAKDRYKTIKEELQNGFLSRKIEEARSADSARDFLTIPDSYRQDFDKVIASMNAQAGRGLVGTCLGQLAIKAICPTQDIRLHKASNSKNAFSWKEGVSMRSINDSFVIPELGRKGLLRANQYGSFMTRTFAENYPYTNFYKAEIRGAKASWLRITEALQSGNIDASSALLYVLNVLWKNSDVFEALVKKLLESIDNWLQVVSNCTIESIYALISRHIDISEARSRLLEVSMHALLQAQQDLNVDLGGNLKPLMQMRTANLKHGNLGDTEIILGNQIIEAWDAKYRNPYLSDALEELREKLKGQTTSELSFGYVVFPEKEDYIEVTRKMIDIEEEFGVEIQVLTLNEWVHVQLARATESEVSEETLSRAWLRSYAESLGQRRRYIAPIDEPTIDWVQSLSTILS